MKLSNFLFIALFGTLIILVACNNKKEDATSTQTTESQDVSLINQDPSLSTNVSGTTEYHYKCPKNCEGGGSNTKGKCPICDTELEHNQAFHAQAPAEPGASPQTPIQIDPLNATPPTTSTPSIQPATEAGAAQNAKGEYHFTCPKGCAGGAGAQANCAKCGTALTHNAAFHQ